MEDLRCEKMFFRALYFLKAMEGSMKKASYVRPATRSWDCYKYEGTLYAEVCLGCRLKRKREEFLFVSLSFTKDGLEVDGHPLLIIVEKEESLLWEAIKEEFSYYPNAVIREDWSVILPWPFNSEASLEELDYTAKSLADSISRAFQRAFGSSQQ